VPGIRNKVRNAVDPSYTAVALAKPTGAAVKCSDTTLRPTNLSSDNTTLYWLTGPVSTVPQTITVPFASTTSINRVRISSNVVSSTAPTVGAIPHPVQLEFTASGRPRR